MYNEEKNKVILRLAPKNKYKWIGALAGAVFSMLMIWYTYKAHTKPPDSFHTIKAWILFYLFGPFFSYIFLLRTIHIINYRYVEIYSDKIIQRVFVKWLPPFERVIHFKPNEMKFKVIYNNGSYSIAFYNSDKDLEVFLSLAKILHGSLYKKVICIGINPSLKLFKIFHLRHYEKSKILKLIDILMENCKSENDKQLLEKLKQKVLAWKGE
jgi:hypothetical protein